MAGETALSAYSTTGVYILEDNNGWVAANTPNTCNLGGDSGLVLASEFIYFDSFNSLEQSTTTPYSENMDGWRFYDNASVWLKTDAVGGQSKYRTFTLSVNVTATQQINFEKFWEAQQVKSGQVQIYLVRQWASTTFKEFVYNTGAKKYSAVVLTGYTLGESSREGKDFQTLTVTMVNAYI